MLWREHMVFFLSLTLIFLCCCKVSYRFEYIYYSLKYAKPNSVKFEFETFLPVKGIRNAYSLGIHLVGDSCTVLFFGGLVFLSLFVHH